MIVMLFLSTILTEIIIECAIVALIWAKCKNNIDLLKHKQVDV